MKPRERWVIGAGAVVVALILFFRGGNRDSISPASGTSSSLSGNFVQVENFDAARRNVKKMTSDLGVIIPQEPPSEQEIALRTQLAQFVQQNGLTLVNLRRADAGGPHSATLKPVQFSLELNGPFSSLMNLVYALEHAPLPFLVQEMSVTSAAAGGQAGPGANSPSSGGGPMPSGGGGPPGSMSHAIRPAGGMPHGMSSGGPPPSMTPSGSLPGPPQGGAGTPDPKQADKIQCTLLVQTHIFPVPPGTVQPAKTSAAHPNQMTSTSQETHHDSTVRPEKRK